MGHELSRSSVLRLESYYIRLNAYIQCGSLGWLRRALQQKGYVIKRIWCHTLRIWNERNSSAIVLAERPLHHRPARFGLDRQQAIVFSQPFGLGNRADFDLVTTPANRQVG